MRATESEQKGDRGRARASGEMCTSHQVSKSHSWDRQLGCLFLCTLLKRT